MASETFSGVQSDGAAILSLRGERVEWRAVDGQVVALDLADSVYFTVNHAGGALWLELAEGTGRERLVATLADNFAVSIDRARDDVDAFLDSLDERGLLARA